MWVTRESNIYGGSETKMSRLAAMQKNSTGFFFFPVFMSEDPMTYSDLRLGIWSELMNIIKVSP